jgi:hypothetical protein
MKNHKLIVSIVVLAFLMIGSQVAEAGSIVLNLKRTTLKNVDDDAGRWQYSGGDVYKGRTKVGHYAVTRRVIFKATEAQNTAMVTMSIFFLREKPPQNITLQGAHDFNSGIYKGSVSAASKKYNWIRDASFTGNTAKKTLRIEWLGSKQLSLP